MTNETGQRDLVAYINFLYIYTMSKPFIENLLKLQECDVRCDRILEQLERIPVEVQGYQIKIDTEHKAIESVKKAVQELELRRKDLDNEVGASEDQLNRYKTQQLTVKKNEEYRALQHEINSIADKISTLEEEEIEVMLMIDESAESAKHDEAQRKATIKEYEKQIVRRSQHKLEFSQELEGAEEDFRKAEEGIGKSELRSYHYVKKQVKRLPIVVPVVEHKCTGCHIKLPTDLEMETRIAKEITSCNNCGRLLYC